MTFKRYDWRLDEETGEDVEYETRTGRYMHADEVLSATRAPSPVPALASASKPSLRARCEQLEQDIAVLSMAFHEVLADHHTDDSTFQVRKEQYLRAAMEENKMIEAMLPHFLEVAGMKLSEPVPAPTKCKYGDPGCPCQDGDSCHYEDTATTKAMTPPVPAPEPVREKLEHDLESAYESLEAQHKKSAIEELARAALALAEESK